MGAVSYRFAACSRMTMNAASRAATTIHTHGGMLRDGLGFGGASGVGFWLILLA